MINFHITEETLDAFRKKFKNDFDDGIGSVLDEIKREWQREFIRQEARMQKQWTPLKTWVGSRATGNDSGPAAKSYAARKRREYYKGKGRGGTVRYLRILKRTGTMIAGYVKGIRVDNTQYSVEIPFPPGSVGIRAKSHQGVIPLPKGVLSARPWDLQRFADVALRVVNRELRRKIF